MAGAALPALSVWGSGMLLWDTDGRGHLSDKRAGSLQTGPRWWQCLSSGMEPGERCWEREVASLGQSVCSGEHGPGRNDSAVRIQNCCPVAGLAEVGTVALTLAFDVSQGSGISASQGVGRLPELTGAPERC